MKKIILPFLILVSVSVVKAQSLTYHPFKLDINIGYAYPSSNNSDVTGGIALTVEPHYLLSDQLAIGLRLEGAILGYSSHQYIDNDISGVSSYCFTANYYFSKSSIRPFIGLGLGAFTQSSDSFVSFDGESTNSPVITKFGAVPQLGIEYQHFCFSVEYDAVGGNIGYTAIKAGFFFGGGKKR